MATLRVSYLTGTSTTGASDGRTAQSALDCSGSVLARFQSHTLTPSSGGTVETNPLPVGTLSINWAICGTGSSGQINVRFEYSANDLFTDTSILFNGVATYPPSGCNLYCFPLVGPAQTPCPYGTRTQAGVSAALNILPSLVEAWATSRGMGWIAVRLAALYYTVLNVEDLCSHPPPQPQLVEPTDFQGSIQEAIVALRAIAWPSLCECIPGTPSAPPYVPWFQPEPTGSPTAPSFPVSTPGDPAALSEILRRLSEIQAVLAQDLELDTLMQRWRLPFGTIPHITHEHLVGEGDFVVDRALGLLVTVTTLPPDLSTFPGNPLYLKDLGWLAVDDGGAMLQELRVTRQQQQWYPAQMQLATRVSWALTPGTEIAIQEYRVEA